jgi:hypothetical protein
MIELNYVDGKEYYHTFYSEIGKNIFMTFDALRTAL